MSITLFRGRQNVLDQIPKSQILPYAIIQAAIKELSDQVSGLFSL